ncbi:MAG TPA: mechanosensitive ion channel family protein [Euzebyales bacterium]|nr:mechanosensitive ion channel family protein [Euzebyales bacterium]
MWFSNAAATGLLLAQEVNVSDEARQACRESFPCTFFLDRDWPPFVAQLLGVLIPDILMTALIFLVAWFLVRVARKAIRSIVRDMVEQRQERVGTGRKRLSLASTQSIDPARAAMRTETLGNVLRSVTSLVIWTAAVFVAVTSLKTIDIELGPLIAGAGIVGVALGFGSQSLVKDFLSGIFMLLEDQYGVGDIVDVGPATGVVEGITLRTTRLRDVEGVVWHVPNGEIARVGNLSQQWSRSLLDIPVAYGTDLNEAISIIKQTADDLWTDASWRGLILEEPDVWGVEAFGDSAILIRIVLKVVPAQQWSVSRELRLRIKAAFDDAGIEIPFPQTVVWVRDEQATTEADDAATGNGAIAQRGPEREPVRSRERERARPRARTGEYDTAPPASHDDGDSDGRNDH